MKSIKTSIEDKLKIIEKFKYMKSIILVAREDRLPIMDLIIKDIGHMGIISISKRKMEPKKTDYGMVIFIKTKIELIAPLQAHKRDRIKEEYYGEVD